MNKFVILFGSPNCWAHQSVDGEDALFEMLEVLEQGKIYYQVHEIVGTEFVRIF